MAIQKDGAMIAGIDDLQSLREHPEIVESRGEGLHKGKIPERGQISNNYLTHSRGNSGQNGPIRWELLTQC